MLQQIIVNHKKKQMNTSSLSYTFLISLTGLYIFLCLLFPAAEMFVNKKTIFILLFCFSIIIFLLNPTKLNINSSVLNKVYTLFLILVVYWIPSFFSSYNFNDAFFLLISILSLLLFLPLNLINSRVFFKLFLIGCFILAFLTILISIVIIYNNVLAIAFTTLFLRFETGYIGKRIFGVLTLIMVHFRTAPVLIIPISYYFIQFCKSKNSFTSLFFILFYSVSIIFTASRGLILFTFFSLFLISFINISMKKCRYIFIFLLIIGLICISYLLVSTNVLSSNEKSNSIKIGHISSFLDLISNSPEILIFGRGTGSQYYSKGFGKYVFQTEITLLDLVRYFGIPGTTLFLLTILIPVSKKLKISYSIPFLFYFINATTNPLIFNSTGTLIILLYFFAHNSWFEGRKS